VPVIAGCGSNNTAHAIELTRSAKEAGADAALHVPPYYNRPNQEGLYQHFKAIAEAVKLPCVLYNVPGRTSRNMEAKTVARLAQISNIIGVKEAGGDMAQVSYIRALTKDDFAIYSGNDGDTLPMLPLGCCGVISVISHIAGKPMRQMMDAFWSGDLSTALKQHLRLMPVCDALFPPTAPNPVAVKAALQLQDFDCGGLRLPLVEATETERENLRRAMQDADLL
jgi:4-hydroxy-tetrahydrodipicolinate synthase